MTKRKPEGWRKTLEQRFWEKVDKTPTCWLWTAAQAGRGWREGLSYGIFGLRAGHNVYAHRFAYEQLIGPIPKGLTLDHLCLVKRCVNPEHLEPVSQDENYRRWLTHHKPATHCPKGHPYSGANLQRWSGGGVRCRTCEHQRYQRRREQVLAQKREAYWRKKAA